MWIKPYRLRESTDPGLCNQLLILVGKNALFIMVGFECNATAAAHLEAIIDQPASYPQAARRLSHSCGE